MTGDAPPIAVSLDDNAARRLRAAGYRVERALTDDVNMSCGLTHGLGGFPISCWKVASSPSPLNALNLNS